MAEKTTDLQTCIQRYSDALRQKLRVLEKGSEAKQVNALEESHMLMVEAWSIPFHGLDVAYSLCEILREEKALDVLVNNLTSTNRNLMIASARLLEQSLVPANRTAFKNGGLETIVKMTCMCKGDTELASVTTGILESLFKTSEKTCWQVIKHGGLDVIIYWCRCNDRVTLKHCAIALSNLALYGSPEIKLKMAQDKVPEWLFPLAFNDDDSIRYYACLAIAVLASHKEIEACVLNSGTLSLVRPFVESHDPQEFGQMDQSHQHGRSSGWLRRLVPVLSSKREEAQALAAFHMAMEASIKSKQGRKEILYDVGAVEPLKLLASAPISTASRLAGKALGILGEEPHSAVTSPSAAPSDSIDSDMNGKEKPIDVFISYRRSNGSHLASLLKVYLQLRGFTVFIDIAALRSGRFDESLLKNVQNASNFIIVLTPNALDLCMADDEKKDSVHKQIVAAMDARLKIITLLDNFHWPPEDQLPADMRSIVYFHGINWIHGFQDACVDKLEQFLLM